MDSKLSKGSTGDPSKFFQDPFGFGYSPRVAASKNDCEKPAEDETVWNLVQRLGKTNGIHSKTKVAETTVKSTTVSVPNSESDDLQNLIREQLHVSEHVPISQTQPFAGAYRRTKSQRWSKEDTERFYKAVENFGSDLFMIRAYMPEFTDKQIYDKFKSEERKNPPKMQKAIRAKAKIPIDQFEQIHGKINVESHYDPEKDPMLKNKLNRPTKSVLCLETNATLGAHGQFSESELKQQIEPEIQGNIMDLFM